MNYKRIYNQIIERATNRVIKGYKERHHIIPRCMGGTDDTYNLVDLTAREHFLCHWLLTEIYPENDGLYYAFWMMCTSGRGNHKNRNYTVGSRIYEHMKIEVATRKSKSMKGKPNGRKGISQPLPIDHYMYVLNDKKELILELYETKTTTEIASIIGNDVGTVINFLKRYNVWKPRKNETRIKSQTRSLSMLNVHGKPVLQYTKEGELINEYPSVEAAKRSGCTGMIACAAAGRQKTAGGYVWKYK